MDDRKYKKFPNFRKPMLEGFENVVQGQYFFQAKAAYNYVENVFFPD